MKQRTPDVADRYLLWRLGLVASGQMSDLLLGADAARPSSHFGSWLLSFPGVKTARHCGRSEFRVRMSHAQSFRSCARSDSYSPNILYWPVSFDCTGNLTSTGQVANSCIRKKLSLKREYSVVIDTSVIKDTVSLTMCDDTEHWSLSTDCLFSKYIVLTCHQFE
jgi:hypothetical protein